MIQLSRNLYKWLSTRKEKKYKFVILGLDGAGKTTLSHALRRIDASNVVPTVGFEPSNYKQGRYDLSIWDLGGGKNFRGVWSQYFAEVHGAIFVIDAADGGRLDDAKAELLKVIEETRLIGKPILIYANKQDIIGALDVGNIAERLSLSSSSSLKSCSYRIISCSAVPLNNVSDTNIQKGFNWLLSTVDSIYDVLQPRITQETQEQEERQRNEREERKKKLAEQKEKRRLEQLQIINNNNNDNNNNNNTVEKNQMECTVNLNAIDSTKVALDKSNSQPLTILNVEIALDSPMSTKKIPMALPAITDKNLIPISTNVASDQNG